jgi:FixJ family two-component response regulator
VHTLRDVVSCGQVHCVSPPSQVVFIVNGDPCGRWALHSLISCSGLCCVSFGSAAEYRASVKPDVPACLILEVNLPDMNGLDLQRQIAATDAPIVFVTDRSDIPSSVRAIKAGAVDFLTSPISESDLLHAVHTAIALDRDTRARRAVATQLQLRFARLTRREREVLELVTAGLPNKQSADELGISAFTLQIHRGNVMRKMEARSFADLIRMATLLNVRLVPYNEPLSGVGISPA